MKKVLIILVCLLFAACRPETRSNEGETTDIGQSENSEPSQGQGMIANTYDMVLKSFDIGQIEKSLNLNPSISQSEDFEMGDIYSYENGGEINVKDGVLDYFKSDQSTSISYLSYMYDVKEWENDGKDEAIGLADKFFVDNGLTNMKLVNSEYADVDEILLKINGGEDFASEKDGEEVNLRDMAEDISVMKYVKTIDDIEVIDEIYQLDNARVTLPASAYIVVAGDDITYIRMHFIPEEINSEKELDIIGFDEAKKAYQDYLDQGVVTDDYAIKDIQLKYTTEPTELVTPLNKSDFTYIPVYEILVEISGTKGDSPDIFTEKVLINASDGSLIK